MPPADFQKLLQDVETLEISNQSTRGLVRDIHERSNAIRRNQRMDVKMVEHSSGILSPLPERQS